MKLNFLKTAIIVLIASISTMFLSSCDKTDSVDPVDPTNKEELKGAITENMTLEEDETYTLTGAVTVPDGVTLTIEPGVTIIAQEGDIVGYLLIEQGGKINAVGTASKPIVMTSEVKAKGAWGGVHICGKAPLNVATPASSEVGSKPYGGNDPHDNSGELKYVRVEYAGFSYDEKHECNGFSLYGVGDGTKLSYLEAYKGSDDGFECFGGTVGYNHCLSIDNLDDAFDWTEGWSGKCQFLVAYQESKDVLGYDCDRLIEADNLEDDFDASPCSHPTFSNLTLIGNNSSDKTSGVTFRRGTQISIYNALIEGKSKTLNIESDQTQTAFLNGTSIAKSVYVNGSFNTKQNQETTPAIYLESNFTTDGNVVSDSDFSFTNIYVGTQAGVTVPSGFEEATYAGAVKEGNDWTIGWTVEL